MWNSLLESATQTTSAIAQKAKDAADAFEAQINEGAVNDFDDIPSTLVTDESNSSTTTKKVTESESKEQTKAKDCSSDGWEHDDDMITFAEENSESVVATKTEPFDVSDIGDKEGEELVATLLTKLTNLQSELSHREEQLASKAVQIASLEEQHSSEMRGMTKEIERRESKILELQKVLESLTESNNNNERLAMQLRKEGEVLAERFGLLEQTLKKSRNETRELKGELSFLMEEKARAEKRAGKVEKDLWKQMGIAVSSSSHTPSPRATTIPPRRGDDPIVELREYALHPSGVSTYVQKTTETSNLRKSLVPLLLFTMPETGGDSHVATHLYHYPGGFVERLARRDALSRNLGWNEYLATVRPLVRSQSSLLFWEASGFIDPVVGLENVKISESDGAGMFEYVRYKMSSMGAVNSFLSLYKENIDAKLSSVDKSTSLVTLLYNETEVVEIWRHGDAETIGGFLVQNVSAALTSEMTDCVVDFKRVFHRPLTFSPLR